MARISVTNLRPLTAQQTEYLFVTGEFFMNEDLALWEKRGWQVWWRNYFHTAADADVVLPEDAYLNPYVDISNPFAFLFYRKGLEHDLRLARTNRKVWENLMKGGGFPPNPPNKDPYTLPEYFSWWQAENAFRRGYSSAFDEVELFALKGKIREFVRAHAIGELTASNMREIAKTFSGDPYIRTFFIQLADDLDAEKNLVPLDLTALWAGRERAYAQFSPHYMPLRSIGGGGFFGVGRRR